MRAGWEARRLGEVTQDTETVNPQQSPQVEFDYIDVSSVSNRTFEIESTQRLLGKDAPSRARRLVRANDVLFATVRPTLQRIAVVPERFDRQVCSTGYIVLRPRAGLDPRFLYYSLFSANFTKQMERLQKGASYPAVTDSEVKAQAIPFPPVSEQRRIVAVLDEAFAAIAVARSNAEQSVRNARELFPSHVNAVLAKQGPAWAEKPLGAVCSFENGDRGTNYPSKSARTATGIPFINAGHLTDDGVDLASMDYISRERFELLSNGKIRRGDILFCLRGSLGKFASVGDMSEGAIASSLVIVRPGKAVLGGYVAAYLASALCSEMIHLFKNGAAQPNLSAQSVRAFMIPVPPLSEQESIVEALGRLRVKTRRLVALREGKLAELDALKQSLLHQAFTGAL